MILFLSIQIAFWLFLSKNLSLQVKENIKELFEGSGLYYGLLFKLIK